MTQLFTLEYFLESKPVKIQAPPEHRRGFLFFGALPRNRDAMEIDEEYAVENVSRWWLLQFFVRGRFHGGVVVEADEFFEAVWRAYLLGLRPHGHIQGNQLLSRQLARTPKRLRNRLLTQPEVGRISSLLSAKEPDA